MPHGRDAFVVALNAWSFSVWNPDEYLSVRREQQPHIVIRFSLSGRFISLTMLLFTHFVFNVFAIALHTDSAHEFSLMSALLVLVHTTTHGYSMLEGCYQRVALTGQMAPLYTRRQFPTAVFFHYLHPTPCCFSRLKCNRFHCNFSWPSEFYTRYWYIAYDVTMLSLSAQTGAYLLGERFLQSLLE